MAGTLLDVVDAVRDGILACLGDECDYLILSTMGNPPAECNSIAVYPNDSQRIGDAMGAASNRCRTTRDETVTVLLTHVCQGIDSDIDWDYELEAEQARCLWRDVQELDECFQCYLPDWLKDHVQCHKDEVYVVGVNFDAIRTGGAYQVAWTIRYQRGVCCPEEA